jgi:hypothetical protein
VAIDANAFTIAVREFAVLLLFENLVRGDRHRKFSILALADISAALALDERKTVFDPNTDPRKLDDKHTELLFVVFFIVT